MKTWPRYIGGCVALAAVVVDVAMGRLLGYGHVFESIVLAAAWLVAAVFILARVPQGAWRRTPAFVAGIAIAHPVTLSLGFDVSQSPFWVSHAVKIVTFVIFMVPIDLCLTRLDAQRAA